MQKSALLASVPSQPVLLCTLETPLLYLSLCLPGAAQHTSRAGPKYKEKQDSLPFRCLQEHLERMKALCLCIRADV